MPRTLLIGLDGATFTILDPLMASGVMPFLARLCAGGVRAELRSTKNPMTMQAWPAIMTGQEPGTHGVLDFVRTAERKGEIYLTLYDSRDLRSETIWSIANRHGMSGMALNFPVMYPPPELPNLHVIPGMTSWKHLRLGMRPVELYDQLKSIAGLDYKEMAWDFEQGKKVVHGIGPEEYESWIRFHIKREHHWFSAARHILQSNQCDLIGILFDGPDKLFHICWRLLDPAWLPPRLSEWERGIRELCLEYFRQMDTYLRDLVEMSGPEASVIIVSDHGFRASTDIFHINVWLEEQGLLAWRTPESLDDGPKGAWKRRLKSNVALLDWEQTKVYAATSSSNGLHIRRPTAPGTPGISVEEYESFRASLIEKLYKVRHPVTGVKVVKQVWTKEEAFGGDQLEDAPDLLLELHDSGFISIKNSPPAVQCRPEVTGTHSPEGIFIAAGPGVREGVDVPMLSILDVAPTVLYCLGLDVPENMPGRVPSEAFRPVWLGSRQIRRAAAATQSSGSSAALRSEAEAVSQDSMLIKKLQDLGYL